MSRLSITLLGSPQVSIDGALLKIPPSRAIPLIAFLAMSKKAQPRETLANLLWAESTQKQALASLRTTLWRLKASGLAEWLVVNRNELALDFNKNIEIDISKFMASLDKCNTHGHPLSQICLYCTAALTEAIEFYHGDFMSGFNITKAPSFDDWRMQQSEALQDLYINALERLVKCYRTFGDFSLAIHYARIWITVDRLNENAYFQLLQLYSITSQRTAGISLYKHYKYVLWRELMIEPNLEMTTLYKQLITGKLDSPKPQKIKTPIFLMIDFENAAHYWIRAGNKKDEQLNAYTAIVKETAHRFGGTILQKSEDNITILFENSQPLFCAVTLHLKLKKAVWGDTGSPNIRMVLYSTFKEVENSNSFATLIKAAASLLSISWGGQIIFSEQTLKILDLPPGSRIKDLGFHILKDLDSPLHIYELWHPNLPAIDHPPLQSDSRQLVNFPTLSPAFVGREPEITSLKALIKSSDNRIISLVGPGGIGKTRLAIQVANQIADSFPDGLFFIPLATIQDPNLIPIVLADTLNFSFYGPRNHIEQLGNYLQKMKALLIFDNFEHLRLEGSRFLAFLLAQTHQLKILVTSRERLNLIAETIINIEGLPVPPSENIVNPEDFSSIELFVHNAQRISPKFSLANNSSSIIRICQLLNGLPLGIILASSWVRVYTCMEIAEEIEKNLDFLATNSPDIASRHCSLRVVFDYSWKLLSNDEQTILCRLSIFRTAFTAYAARAISSAMPFVLYNLVDKSLLQTRQDDRFEMMETFHLYVSDKLMENLAEYAEIKQKYCDYYLDYCTNKHLELNSKKQRQALNDLTSEIENIRTAWNWLIESDRWDRISKMVEPLLTYHVIIANFAQGRQFFRLALSKMDRLNDPEVELIKAAIQQCDTWLAIRNGFITEGLPRLEECMQIFRSHNSQWELTLAYMLLAEANHLIGNIQQGKDYIENALELFKKTDFPQTDYVTAIFANCQAVVGGITLELGDYDLAQFYFESSLETHNKIGTMWGAITPILGLGKLAYRQGEFIRARDLLLQALEIATNIYDPRGLALIHNNLSDIYEKMVQTVECVHHMQSALNLCVETGDRRLTAIILNNLAYQQLRFLKHPTDAIRAYHESIEIFSELGDLRGLAYTCYDVSIAYLQSGLIDEAWNYCSRSLHTAITLDSLPMILHALHGFINLLMQTHQPERALRLCYLIINHPEIEPGTQRRVIVSMAILETSLPPELLQPAHNWAESTNLQDIIDLLLINKTHSAEIIPI